MRVLFKAPSTRSFRLRNVIGPILRQCVELET
jgi:hypothetical protein